MIKRTLEKIALIMEMQQKNVLKKDDLMTILDDVSSNLALTFLTQVPLEDLYERTVLKDNIDFVEFENTEFQEYLAAKEITRLGRLDQVVFDLVVDQYSKEIFPSWFNTLGFIVDLNPKLLRPIIQYSTASERNTKDEEYFRFLTHIDPNKLTVADKVEIFVGVFNYYNEVFHWMPPDICRNLSYYFDSSIAHILKEAYEDTCKSGDKGFIKKGNLAYVVGFLIERKVFQKSEILFWRNILLKFGEDKNGVVQRHVLDALAKIGDMENIIKLKNLIGKDKLVEERFIDACATVDPNHPVSMQAFVQAIKNDNIYARYCLYKINKPKGIGAFLKALAEDKDFLTEFIDREDIYNGKDEVLIELLEKYWNTSMKNEVKKILKTAFSDSNWYDSQRSKFLKQLISLVGRKDNVFIYVVLEEIEKDKSLQGHLFGFEEIFKCLLSVNNVKGFVEVMKKLNWGNQIACSTLLSFYGDKDKRIYKVGRKFFRKEYESFEQGLKKSIEKSADEKEKERILKKFRELSEPSPGKYNLQVFRFYLDNKEKLDLDKKDKARLKKLLIGSVFKKIDPRKATVKWNKDSNSNGARNYTITSAAHIFGDCLAIASDLKLNIHAYRKKIIAYIPFSYSQHLKSIFELVQNVTPQEAKKLLNIYTKKRDDDLVTFMPSSFIESCEKYGITEAIPVLKEFVNNENLSMYDRRTSLKVICDVEPDQVYLSTIFKKYSAFKETSEIAEIANEYLMTIFNDEKSIKWRFKEIKERCFSYIEPTGPHFVAVETHVTEIHDKKFAGPIMNLKKVEHIDLALELLDFSFDLMKEGESYQSYVMYIWEIVMKYFDNLKEHRVFNYYKRLEDHVKKNSHREGINWFTIRLQGLLRSYLEFMGKPKDITDCIKKYNAIKVNQYLDVTRIEDLVEIAKDVFNKDVRSVIENEGIYKIIQQSTGIQEVLIQKTLVPYIEAAFLRKGFRQNEVKVIREAQSSDDKRTDFLIFYGFWGPIVVEVKRSDNKEVFQKSKRKAYKNKLLHYITISKASYGFFLIFQINDEQPLEKVMPALRQEYEDCKNIFISGFNCLLAPN